MFVDFTAIVIITIIIFVVLLMTGKQMAHKEVIENVIYYLE